MLDVTGNAIMFVMDQVNRSAQTFTILLHVFES